MTSTPARRPSGVHLGSVAGAPVVLGWSWFALGAILVVIAGQNLRSLGGTAYLVGLAYAVVLLGSVLAHEIAHAVAARSQGMRVTRITADLLGGHTAFEENPRSPGATALVAAAGPAANLALAAAAYPLHEWLAGDPSTRVAALMMWGVMWANVFLGGFNLLPGMPLDGGRVVVALVWKLTGRQPTGWIVAGFLGIGVTLAVIGWFVVWPLMQGEGLDVWDLAWLVLVIPFLWRGARMSIGWGMGQRAMEGVSVAEVTTPVAVLSLDDRVGDAAALGVDVIAADEDGTLCLFASAGDLERLAGARPDAPLSSALSRVGLGSALEIPAGAPAVALGRGLADRGDALVLLIEQGRPYALTSRPLLNAALRDRLRARSARG